RISAAPARRSRSRARKCSSASARSKTSIATNAMNAASARSAIDGSSRPASANDKHYRASAKRSPRIASSKRAIAPRASAATSKSPTSFSGAAAANSLTSLAFPRRETAMTRLALKSGIFLAPFHPVHEDPTIALRRDIELVEHLDQLGFEEAWIGEHHSAGF